MTLIEREDEVRRVRELLAGARAGHGATLLVEGTPGIGKTALLAAARDHAARHAMTTLTARGGELERDLAFAIVRQLFEPHLHAASPEVRAELLSGAAGLAAAVFGAGQLGEDAGGMGAVVHGLYWLCSNLAEQGPLVLVVDDAHWADEPSLRFLSHAARRIAELPVLLVLATRPTTPGEADSVARALSGIQPDVVRLGPLSEQAVRTLIRAQLSPDAEDSFCRACARLTGGNPFLLTETVVSLRADGVNPVAAETHRLEDLRPETISRSVLARLARFGPHAVRLARAVAILGPAADLRHTAMLSDLSPRQAADLVDALQHEGLVVTGQPIEFAHPLLRTAVYTDTSQALRAVAHKQAARMLAADRVAPQQLVPHLLAAAPDADPWMTDALRQAASEALGRGAPEPAAACLERALAEPPAPAARGAVLAEFGHSLGMLNRPTEAADAFRAALDLAPDTYSRIEIALNLGRLMVMTGHGRRASEIYAWIHRISADSEDEIPLHVLGEIAIGQFTAMEHPNEWLPRLDAVVNGLGGGTEQERLILAVLAFGAAATGDRPSAEVARLATLAATGTLPPQPWILVNLASAALTMSDHLPRALDLLDRGIQVAQGTGDISAFGYLSVLRSHSAIYAGRLLEAEADGRAALDVYQEGSADTPLAAAVLVDALVDQGDLSGAHEVLVTQGIEDEQPLSMLLAHFIHTARGKLRRSQQRPRDALADLLLCGKGLTTAGYTNPGFANWRSEAALAHLSLGQLDEARELAAEDLALSRAFGAPRAIALALRTAAQTEGGPTGMDLLREAVNLLDGSPAELEHARVLIDYGAALRRSGHRIDAQAPLRQGLDLATRCTARTLAKRASEELVSAGARPRRAAQSGPAALTASELRVTRLAADGSTNREIAQALFVTRRTVEVHLSSAYRKLGITSRQEIRKAMGAPSAPATDTKLKTSTGGTGA